MHREGGSVGDVIVLGSVNVDHAVYVDALPERGETILARGAAKGLGGKGANQAVAASRFGAKVHLLGRIGADDSGGLVLAWLENFGVSVEGITASEMHPTGTACITVDSAGENTISVVSGANAEVDAESLKRAFHAANSSTRSGGRAVGLAQGETPAAATEEFALLCRQEGARFVLNLAPVIDMSPRTLGLADPLVLNEGEARVVMQRLLGELQPVDSPQQAVAAARKMVSEGLATSMIITLGSDGAVVASGERAWHQIPPVPPQVVDTTGAGDAFVGAVAAMLSTGAGLHEATRWAVAAGSAAVSKRGASESYSNREDIRHLLGSAELTGS